VDVLRAGEVNSPQTCSGPQIPSRFAEPTALLILERGSETRRGSDENRTRESPQLRRQSERAAAHKAALRPKMRTAAEPILPVDKCPAAEFTLGPSPS